MPIYFWIRILIYKYSLDVTTEAVWTRQAYPPEGYYTYLTWERGWLGDGKEKPNACIASSLRELLAASLLLANERFIPPVTAIYRHIRIILGSNQHAIRLLGLYAACFMV